MTSRRSTRSERARVSSNLIAWHGYTEDGTTEGYEEYDWVTPFEDETGCQVDVTYADSSDEMVQLMRSGRRGRRTTACPRPVTRPTG